MKKIIVTESQMKLILENEEYINQLIDKIGEFGRDSLTPSEKKYLEGISSHEGPLKYYQGPGDEYSDYDDQRGEKITSTLPGIPTMIFKYDYQEKDGDDILIYGSFFFNDEEYYGVIISSQTGNLIGYDFQIGEMEYDGSDYKSLFDVTEGLEHEVEVFLEDEVIPRFL